MKIYILRASDALFNPDRADDFGFSRWCDPHGFVVVAKAEGDARILASKENGGGVWWLDTSMTTCEVIEPDGDTRVIMANQPTG